MNLINKYISIEGIISGCLAVTQIERFILRDTNLFKAVDGSSTQ